MSNKEAELISRTTYRRMSRQKRARTVQAVKMLLIWMFAITVNIAFIHAMIYLLWRRPILCGILLITFTWNWARLFDDITQKIKKSPRNGHSRRGQAK